MENRKNEFRQGMHLICRGECAECSGLLQPASFLFCSVRARELWLSEIELPIYGRRNSFQHPASTRNYGIAHITLCAQMACYASRRGLGAMLDGFSCVNKYLWAPLFCPISYYKRLFVLHKNKKFGLIRTSSFIRQCQKARLDQVFFLLRVN